MQEKINFSHPILWLVGFSVGCFVVMECLSISKEIKKSMRLKRQEQQYRRIQENIERARIKAHSESLEQWKQPTSSSTDV